ncbi:YggS family pyridoxal phosphate enzyme [Deinococcus frigens]|uniref:YggS family pyridoxal phosphate enzyme n=1 Tax=Deinococcus frigens TaxID=249403 RepID=UPI0004981A3C|nr:alanine racemase [Deinococcus frigens]
MSLPEVVAHLRALEAEAGREPGSARLVAVTKGQDLESIERQVLAHGSYPLGEGRAQELRDKAAERPDWEWHYIGPLQRNKIKYLRPVTLVHAIEAVWQAEAIAEAAARWGHAPDLLLQLHNGEEQKHGVLADELADTLRGVRETGLTVRGLMVMAPDSGADLTPPEAETRILRLFTETAQRAHDLGLPELSMGMSGDYPQAVRAGATLVRVGRSLFQ